MSAVREYYKGRTGRTAGSGSALRTPQAGPGLGWAKQRTQTAAQAMKAVCCVYTRLDQGPAESGLGGGDRNGLLGAAALGDRARGTHTAA